MSVYRTIGPLVYNPQHGILSSLIDRQCLIPPLYDFSNPLSKYTRAIYICCFFFQMQKLKFHWKHFDIYNIFAQIIDCGYTLEPPCRDSSNEYPQSMFWVKNKKNRYNLEYSTFIIEKWGSEGYTFNGHVILMLF